MTPPRASYRLQFHAGFTFDDAAAIVPGLAGLGISHVYASPILQARRGSSHGYDVVDPRRINAELGGEDGFRRFSAALRENGIGLILDIVPNHMATGPENPWWMSVLAEGQASPHARVFDIDWARADGKVILPVLGDPYGEVLHRGDIVPGIDDAGRPVIRYFDMALPLREGSVPRDCGTLEAAVERLRGEPGDPASFDRLHAVLERQHWRLAWWRTAWSDINYRRFFEIDALVGVRVEEPDVFDATHATLLALAREGLIQGLRVDHIDGLADPAAYLTRLRRVFGPDMYIVVEKILAADETLPPWPIQGTTGYEVLNWIDGLLVNRAARDVFDQAWHAATGDHRPMAGHCADAKRLLLARAFAGEVASLVQDLSALARSSRVTRDLMPEALREALLDLLVAFPVYRTYRDGASLSDADRRIVDAVLARAKATTGSPTTQAHDFIAGLLTGPVGDPAGDAPARIVRKVQQLTGPVMAKSLEDTAFYRRAPLLALNEVGGEPEDFGLDAADFHRRMDERARHWPHAMIATTTHDTKRGEDARARLFAATHEPSAWTAATQAFAEATAPLATPRPAGDAPDATDRIILMQALLGAWPFTLLADEGREADWQDFAARMGDFALKAIREAKRRTAWTRQDAAYEDAVAGFVDRLFAGERPVLRLLQPLARDLAAGGAALSLVRTVLKLTLPGVPDFYQGTELWDVSMVDPDNRRPVDYGQRTRRLAQETSLEDELAHWVDGGAKLELTRRLLAARAADPVFFAEADYEPWTTREDPRLFGFHRRLGQRHLLVIADVGPPLPLAPPLRREALAVDRRAGIALPAGSWRDLASGEQFHAPEAPLPFARVFATLPAVALWR